MPYKNRADAKAREKWRKAGRVGPPPTLIGRTGGEPARPMPNILDAAMPSVSTVRPQVREDRTPLSVAAPLHESASTVPEAGAETDLLGGGKPDTTPTAEPVQLEPETMIALTKGAFAMVGLVMKARSGGDDREIDAWKVEDDEIREIAEPMCRQAMRIPIVAALGQNTADLILIGATMGTLISLRISASIELGRDRRERIAATRPRAVPRDGETYETFRQGNLTQEVREPADPHDRPNLKPFAVAR